MGQAAEREHPVHLIVEQVQRQLVSRTSPVFLQDGVADGSEGRGIESSSGRIDRRIEHQESGAAERAGQAGGGGEKRRVAAALDRNGRGARQLAIVIVVPRGHREDDPVAMINRELVRREEARP